MPVTHRRNLLWLIGGRAAVLTLLLGSAILIQVRAPGAFPIDPFFALIGLTYALTALWAATLRYVDRRPWLVDVQVACDALIVSAIVHLTGGVASYYSSLYALPIIAASTVQSWRGGMMVAVLSSLVYAGLVFGQYQPGSPLPVAVPLAALPDVRVAMFTVGLNVFGFFAVGALSGYLAEGLRRTGEQLEAASTQLADLQALSQHVIDSMTSGLATCDVHGRLLTFNRAAEAITAIDAATASGADVRDLLQLPRDLADLVRPEAPRRAVPRVEYAFRRGDGRSIELGISCAPLMTPRGVTGLLFTFQDITDVKKQEREARTQQRLAAVGEMAAGIAHEIRNPLASMAGSIQILRDELPLTAEQSQLMDIVLRESDRLNETIRGFLAYARPQRATMADIDVRRVITDTARLLENNAEVTERHAIEVDVPADPLVYCADEAQIRQVVWNLATNGLRAMPRGGRLRLGVRRTAEGEHGAVVLAVEDEGVGIAPEDLDGIFQPFRGGFGQGTGLGLSIVHRIASDYRGEVRVKSRQGRGTTVEVVLPLEAAGAAAAAALPRVNVS
jgi:two-component system sensor histidine kinase PilS (NtrC family)